MERRKKQIKKKEVINKIRLVCIILFIVFAVAAAIADKTGLCSYEHMMSILHLGNEYNYSDCTTVSFIDVGQGDSELISSNGHNILIDAGESEKGAKVVSFLQTHAVDKLDYVVATHPHSDHIGGLKTVLSEYEVDHVIMPDLPDELVPSSRMFEGLLDIIDEKNIDLIIAEPGQKYEVGDVKMTVLGPVAYYKDLNNSSVVLRVKHGNNTFLFMGDAENESEKDLLNSDAVLEADVIKVGHHGSSSSSGEKFIKKVFPEYAVISCGAGNSYGHPSEKTVNIIDNTADHIYRTDLKGSVIFKSDGEHLDVSFEE